MLGVLKLDFFSEIFATKRLFFFGFYAGPLFMQAVFRFLFKKYSERDGRR